MRQSLKVNWKKCVGCRICEEVCSWAHFRKVQPSRSRIKIERIHSKYKNIPRVCRQCTKAPCIDACPVGAIYRNSETNAAVVDEQKCNGCGECLDACPFDAIFMDPIIKTVLICDLCQGEPNCVKYCPENAIELKKKRTSLKSGEGSAND